MKKLKAFVAVILAAVVVLGLFGCTQQPTDYSVITNSKEELEKFMNLEGLPIVKDGASAELTVFIATNPNAADVTEMPWTKQIEEATGVKIKWIAYSSEVAGEKLKQLILSGDLPDVIFGAVSSYTIVEYMDQGVFRPVDDLMAEYMPNLSAVYQARPQYKAMMTAPNGKIYGFPAIEEMEGMTLAPSPIYVYKPWLDKLGMEIPDTLDELRTFLEKVRDTDLNENGKHDEIPFTFQLGGWDAYEGYHQILGCFGINDNYSHLTVMDGKVVNTTTLDSFKEGIKYLHQMYADGLIDREAFTSLPSGDPRSRIMNLLNAREVTVGAVQLFDVMNEIYISSERASEYVPLPQLTGPNGDKAALRYNTSEVNAMQAVISATCKYPELAARWIDYMYDPEQSVYANWGTLDYVYVKDQNGVLRWDVDEDGEFNYKQGYSSVAEMRFASTIATGPKAILNEYYGTIVEYPRDAKVALEAERAAGLDEILENVEYFPPVWYTIEEQETIAQYGNYITNLMNSTVTRWMVEGGVDEGWDNYQQQLKNAELDALMAVYQAAYDRYVALLNSIE